MHRKKKKPRVKANRIISIEVPQAPLGNPVTTGHAVLGRRVEESMWAELTVAVCPACIVQSHGSL
jgi:hypothetical protein